MKKTMMLFALGFAAMAVHAQDDAYVYTTDFSTSDGVAKNGEQIVGGGQFVATDDETAIFKTYFQNVSNSPRQNYCLLPEDVLAHAATTKELTIAFWVSAEGFTPNQYTYSPLFTAYAQKNTPNSWPMLALQSRGPMQINLNGWCDFTGAQHVNGKVNIYNQNAWEANDGSFNFVENWLEDQLWHYYTAVFTETNVKIYLDGVGKNEWNVDGVSEGQIISGLFTSGSELKYVCLGGNQAWDWNDGDAPFRFARLLIKNSAMTAEDIKAQIKADFSPLDFDDYITGIKTVQTSPTNATIYNIVGQQQNGLQKGLNIVEGKKVYVK